MAEEKKSFVAYADWEGQFNLLSDEEAGKLIKHIFLYVNDQNPTFNEDERLLIMAFEPIKRQLKRDLKKYEQTKKRRAEAGKKSAEARAAMAEQKATNSTNADFVQHNSANSTNEGDTVTVNVNDTVNGNDTDTVTVNDKYIKFVSAENEFSSTQKKTKSFEERKEAFKKLIDPFRDKYESEMLNDFWRYWTETNPNGKKMRFEMQKVFDVGRRLGTWKRNDEQKFKSNGKSNSESRQQRVDEVAELGRLAKAIISGSS